MGQLYIFKSSAGSGKTYTLAREFIQILIKDPLAHKNILAVTFTNKATAEMKERILKFLFELSQNKNKALMDDIVSRTTFSAELVQNNAGLALSNIVNDYGRLSVTTIDSFFQKILKSFAAELGLYLKYDVELDLSKIVDWVVEQMLLKVKDDLLLKQWLQKYVSSKIEEGKSVKEIKKSFKKLSIHLFTEKFYFLNNHFKDVPVELENFETVIEELLARKRAFFSKVKTMASEAMETMAANDLSETDFSYGSKGVYGYFSRLASGDETTEPNSYVNTCLENPQKWVPQKNKNKAIVLGIVEGQLHPALVSLYDFIENNIREINSVNSALKNIYTFGVISYLKKMKNEYISEFNQIPISETLTYVQDIIGEAKDAPFIYEKTGSFLKHILIDETQDTSNVQWANLRPVVENILASSGKVLIVGDVKQSIYRWRGGELNLLMNKIEQDLASFELHKVTLERNFRSQKKIISFNNELYEQLAMFKGYPWQNLFKVYEDSSQLHDHLKEDKGYVRIEFFEKDEEGGATEKALARMISLIKGLLARGVSYKEVALLIRSNKEGTAIATALKESNIPFISSESLFIQNSEVIRFIISILKIIIDKYDLLSKAYILHFYYQYLDKNRFFNHDIYHVEDDKGFKAIYNILSGIDKLSVFEAIENIVSRFHLQDYEPAFIQRLQDLAMEYSNKASTTINGFLTWWDEEIAEGKISVMVPEGEDAVQIVTIHKSKGLEYPVVIIPFASWETRPKSDADFWVVPEKGSAVNLPFLPVKTGKHLLETEFEGQYLLEWESNFIDEINTLYVASTRAERELYMLAEAPIVNKDKDYRASFPEFIDFNAINVFLYHACKSMTGNFDGMNFEYGTPEEQATHHEKKASKKSLFFSEYYINSEFKDSLKITGAASDRIKRGKLLHYLLENIPTVDKIEYALKKARLKGMITKEEVINYQCVLNELIVEHPVISTWFNGSWQIFAEKEIVDIGSGQSYRPDRIMLKGDKIVIVDYKVSNFGSRESDRELGKYQRQLKNYARQIEKLGYEKPEAYLLYTLDKEIVPVAV